MALGDGKRRERRLPPQSGQPVRGVQLADSSLPGRSSLSPPPTRRPGLGVCFPRTCCSRGCWEGLGTALRTEESFLLLCSSLPPHSRAFFPSWIPLPFTSVRQPALPSPARPVPAGWGGGGRARGPRELSAQPASRGGGSHSCLTAAWVPICWTLILKR